MDLGWLSVAHLALAVLLLLLCAVALRALAASRALPDLIPPLVCLALAYDNVVIGLGASIGEGSDLMHLTVGRFWSHAVLTPLLIVWAVAASRRIGVAWAQDVRGRVALYFLTFGLVLVGVIVVAIRLELDAKTWQDVLRYTSPDLAGVIPAAVTGIVLLVIGITMQRQFDLPGLAIGGAAVVALSAAGPWLPTLASAGEVILLGGIVVTMLQITSRGAFFPAGSLPDLQTRRRGMP